MRSHLTDSQRFFALSCFDGMSSIFFVSAGITGGTIRLITVCPLPKVRRSGSLP